MRMPFSVSKVGRWSLALLAIAGTVAIMCAEAVPWRCHRSMIAEALLVLGVPVAHIMSPTKIDPHRLTSFARVEGNRITYPSTDLALFGYSAPLI